VISVSVCLSATDLRNHTSILHQIFCACCIRYVLPVCTLCTCGWYCSFSFP